MYSLIKPLLFLLSAEKAHNIAHAFMPIYARFLPNIKQELKQATNIDGILYPNRLGVAAGFDKNAINVDALNRLGFGFIEIGTVTPLPQEGNPKPRLFRLIPDRAIINRMGFNNAGLDVVVENLKKVKNRQNKVVGGQPWQK